MFNRRIGLISSMLALMVSMRNLAFAQRPHLREAPPAGKPRSRAQPNKRWKPRGPANRVYCRADAHKPVKYVQSIVRIDGIAHRHQDGQLVPRVRVYQPR